MRKFVSLGAAMMMGVVVGREQRSPTLQKRHSVLADLPDTIKQAHLEKPVALPIH